MATIYSEIPHNFEDIKESVIVEKEQIVNKMILADKIFFYDTCSFRKHIQILNHSYLFEFIKKHNGIVVITRCILMELASHSGVLNTEYVDYIKEMNAVGIEVIILDEEDLFDILKMCFTTNTVINDFLSWAVRVIKRPNGTVTATLKQDKRLQSRIMQRNVSDVILYKEFFGSVRNNKESADSLGEELMVICLHVLANLPNIASYRYVVFTDDKGAIGLINKASKNVFEYADKYAFSALTTARLAQRLHEEDIITNKEQIVDVLSVIASNGVIKILGSEEYDLEAREKIMTCSELAEKIAIPNTIHINF